jgi:uncharacterized protein YjbJ (UPF0337 family)
MLSRPPGEPPKLDMENAVNEDRLEGAGREFIGKVERVAGGATGSDQLKSDGVVDQVTGAIQHGFGEMKDAAATAIGGVPSAVSGAMGQGRRLAHRTDDALRNTLGEHRHLYVVAGAITLLALSILWAGRERYFEA